jgi:hypothetical protein
MKGSKDFENAWLLNGVLCRLAVFYGGQADSIMTLKQSALANKDRPRLLGADASALSRSDTTKARKGFSKIVMTAQQR